MKIAILNDYQNVALKMADWSLIPGQPEIIVFNDHVADPEALAKRLLPFDVICVMRERTPLTAALIEKLPNLKLIASTGSRNASIDLNAAEARGIKVLHTGYEATATIEFVWALILGMARNIAGENLSLKSGGWQTLIGENHRGHNHNHIVIHKRGIRIVRPGIFLVSENVINDVNQQTHKCKIGPFSELKQQ